MLRASHTLLEKIRAGGSAYSGNGSPSAEFWLAQPMDPVPNPFLPHRSSKRRVQGLRPPIAFSCSRYPSALISRSPQTLRGRPDPNRSRVARMPGSRRAMNISNPASVPPYAVVHDARGVLVVKRLAWSVAQWLSFMATAKAGTARAFVVMVRYRC
jgi:hypothetical protein